MNEGLFEQVVNAVLYEGYILYPYRATAKKNRQRFTFGRVYPESYSAAENGAEPYLMQTECLVMRAGAEARLEVSARFLHPMAREIGVLSTPLAEWPGTVDVAFDLVPELHVDGEIYSAWEEAVEREVRAPRLRFPEVWATPGSSLSSSSSSKTDTKPRRRTSTNQSSAKLPGSALTPALPGFGEERPSRAVEVPFRFEACRTLQPIRNRNHQVIGVILRRQAALEGRMELSLQPVDGQVFKLRTRILNHTPVPSELVSEQATVLMRTFASTHTLLRAEGAEFLSLLDPPAQYRQAAGDCENIGTWPVLVGDEQKRERDALLSSPIILYDYPKIAAESPGSFFDGTEIDEMLALRVLTMTEEEKREMRSVDEQARRLLERTEALPASGLLRLHGAMRAERSPEEEIFGAAGRLESVAVGGIELRPGARVRLRPKGRTDVFDLALAGKIAVVEAVEQDAEQRVHLAVVVESDPGKDLGLLRLPGHRFFYGLDEVEPLGEDE